MGINFPTAPAIGTIHPNPAVVGVPQYVWDGEKWISGTGGGAIYISVDPPQAPVGSLWWESDTGILYVRYYDGSSTQWVAIAGGAITGFLPLTGGVLSGSLTLAPPAVVTATANANRFGDGNGTLATGALPDTDANILLYKSSVANWAGLGADIGGNMWFRTGTADGLPASMYIDPSQVAHFLNSPVAPTPATGDNSLKLATTQFIKNNCIIKSLGTIRLYVSPSGNDSNDGSSPASAFKTLGAAVGAAYRSNYNASLSALFIDGQNFTYQEQVSVMFPLNGGGVLVFENLTWKPLNNGICLQFGDNALVGLTNVTFSTAGVTNPKGLVVGHQYGVLDVNTGVVISCSIALNGDAFTTDGLTHFNINNGLTFNASTLNLLFGTAWGLAPSAGKATYNIQGPFVFNANISIGRWAWSTLNSVICVSSNVTYSGPGVVTAAGGPYINQGGIIQNLGPAMPGGAATAVSGGIYATDTTS